MNKKRNVDSGRKSARPDYIQKTISQKSSGKRSGKVFFPKTLIKTGGIIIFVLLLGFAGNKFFLSVSKTDSGKVKVVSASGADEEKEGRIIEKTKKTKEIKETKDVVEMKKTKEINFQPHCVDSTKPENLISYTNIEVDGNVLENIGDYKADGDISFNIGQDYTDVDGIVTFRGNSFRDTPSHGYADMTDFRLNKLWSADTGSLSSGSAVWTGSGWTGQPLMMKWPKEVKAHMNMTEKAKADDELVEVIYACMDGYVYFLDLRTGEKTRDPLYLGYTFKGAGALDPRGYPIMYVGAGYNSNEGTAKVFVVNLLDCSVMYTFGDNDEFSLRGSLSFFDGSALVDAETDTLIYPGENGILYLIRLNTKYDLNSGTLSIDPGRTVKWRYYGTRSSTESFWLGMEDSAAIYKGYIFMTDNGGNLMCLDLNTLQLVWVQSTIACGKNSLADYIYVTVAKTSDNASGVLACLRKSDGSKVWEDSSSYAWSSPVCVYNKDGSGKVLYCNSTGDIRLLDGKTGKQEDVLSVSEGVIEASPAVYDNYAVVGTRDCKIWGIRLQ